MIVQLRKKEISLVKKRWCDHRGGAHHGHRQAGSSNWDFNVSQTTTGGGGGGSGRSGSSRWDLESYRFDETINNAIHGTQKINFKKYLI